MVALRANISTARAVLADFGGSQGQATRAFIRRPGLAKRPPKSPSGVQSQPRTSAILVWGWARCGPRVPPGGLRQPSALRRRRSGAPGAVCLHRLTGCRARGTGHVATDGQKAVCRGARRGRAAGAAPWPPSSAQPPAPRHAPPRCGAGGRPLPRRHLLPQRHHRSLRGRLRTPPPPLGTTPNRASHS